MALVSICSSYNETGVLIDGTGVVIDRTGVLLDGTAGILIDGTGVVIEVLNVSVCDSELLNFVAVR